jgi:hypothetical protein
MLRSIFGPKNGYVTGDARKLYNMVLHDLYSLPDYGGNIKKDEMGESIGTYARINDLKNKVNIPLK